MVSGSKIIMSAQAPTFRVPRSANPRIVAGTSVIWRVTYRPARLNITGNPDNIAIAALSYRQGAEPSRSKG
jgi:hypothetical protein